MPMPKTIPVAIKELKLDLANFRTVRQRTELSAIRSMISMSPDYFWELTESLIDNNYLPTENIIVLKGDPGTGATVKEGNRRIAALKLIFGIIKTRDISVPDNILTKIRALPSDWKKLNCDVPCAIYNKTEASVVDRIVALTHGKGEKAGRDQWNAVAHARHNRDSNKANEPALDLLEKFLKHAQNITADQRVRWSGRYPLSLLAEVIQKISLRFGLRNSIDFAKKYPSLPKVNAIDDIMRDIGLGVIHFDTIRSKELEFVAKYELPALPEAEREEQKNRDANKQQGFSNTSRDGSHGKNTAATGNKKLIAVSTDDPRYVMRTLKSFVLLGDNREKVVELRNEAKQLKIKNNPLAFCFLLRSMFEISAKAFCDDHKRNGGPLTVKANGDDRQLVDVLRDVTTYLTNNQNSKAMKKVLHGAMTELERSEGLLSVTSMNQLIHNPHFSVSETDICKLFGRVYPLLEEMNK